MRVRLIPVGDVQEKIVSNLAENLKIVLKARSEIVPNLGLPTKSLNKWRGQHAADDMIEALIVKKRAQFVDRDIPTIFLTDQDIYYHGKRYVFSLYDPDYNSILISIHRLREEFYESSPDPEKLSNRLLKQVIHELGHYKGLKQCINPGCVMAESLSTRHIDRKAKGFCRNCQYKSTLL